MDLIVKSLYIDSDSFKFYIKNFTCIIQYLHYAHNYNKYYLVITNETALNILEVNNHLLKHKKNPEFNRENLFFICSTNEQTEWCSINNFNFIMDGIDITNIFKEEYIPKNITKLAWSFAKHSRFIEYYKNDKIKIIHIEGFEHNWDIIPYLNNNIYTFVTWPCYFHKWLYEVVINTHHTQNKNYNMKNIIFLSPDLDGILWSHEYGFNAILCNHNCFLDYNMFCINSKIEDPNYDMVMNCRPEKFKRPNLAECVENLAYIKGSIFNKNELYDYTQLKCKYINENRITPLDVIEIYNNSYCGGIFSEKEGACYSSSEYLLCGLPVISTLSRGGRDSWYNTENSIIVEASADKVKEAADICKFNINNNIFNRTNIRDTHIEQSNQMRQNFIDYTSLIFKECDISINSKDYWDNVYFHKMIKNENTNIVIDILTNLSN